jgi:hypothetical protein
MAIKLTQSRKLNALEIISKGDDALDMERSNWGEYEKSYDSTHLCFLPGKEPTRFVVNFELTGKQSAKVKNSMFSGRDEDDGTPKVALGDWSFRVVKYSLKDIKNPSDLPEAECIKFQKDENGYAHDDLLATLDKHGIVNEIFSAYTTLVQNGPRANSKN